MKICPKCGAELDDNVVFCTKCGVMVRTPYSGRNDTSAQGENVKDVNEKRPQTETGNIRKDSTIKEIKSVPVSQPKKNVGPIVIIVSAVLIAAAAVLVVMKLKSGSKPDQVLVSEEVTQNEETTEIITTAVETTMALTNVEVAQGEEETETSVAPALADKETVKATEVSIQVLPAVSVDVSERVYEPDGTGYTMTYTGIDAKGNIVWTYDTEKNPFADLICTELVAVNNGVVYLTDNGNLKAFDLGTGVLLWEDIAVGGSTTHAFDSEGNLYICGFYNKSFIKVSPQGRKIYTSSSFGDSFWPYDMKIEGDVLKISFDGSDGPNEQFFNIRDGNNVGTVFDFDGYGTGLDDVYRFIGATDINCNVIGAFSNWSYRDIRIENGMLYMIETSPEGVEYNIRLTQYYGYLTQKMTNSYKLDAYVFSGSSADGTTMYVDFFPENGFVRITNGNTNDRFYYATGKGMYLKDIIGFR